jgi:protein-tyrosine phosphatase
MQRRQVRVPLQVVGIAVLAAAVGFSAPVVSADQPVPSALTSSYDRLLPLEGGSNFRDMGGYFTADGRQVRRSVLFRSGVMTSLTPADQAYLAGFGFERVIDLRSAEERDLYPNRWATAQGIEVLAHDYSMAEIVQRMLDEEGQPRGMQDLYRAFPSQLEPQLKIFFNEVLAGNVPLVVNCSAGQDRTGMTAALFLLALGVPRDVVLQDYLISTRYRRPAVERGDVDLAAAAKDNLFASLMLRYAEDQGHADAEPQAQPLLTDQGVPFLRFALEQIEQDFGSVERYLEVRIGVDAEDRRLLQSRYLVAAGASR